MLPNTAGELFTLALTTEGEVFGWGGGNFGQHCIPTGGGFLMDLIDIKPIPVQIRGFGDER